MKTLALLLATVAAMPIVSAAAETRFESGPAQTALLELYTSEGCSSCPPAEAWLSRLKGEAGLWTHFVPLAFHVDYWDRLGWRDRFSSRQWTERQGRYAVLWRSESVYTPAVVVNGREQRGWSSADFSRPNDKQAGDLRVATNDGKIFAIEFRPTKGSAGDYDAHLALLGSGISTAVRAGENSGRNLAHDFVVLDLQEGGMKSEGKAMRSSLTISAAAEKGARPAVAVWVTPRGQLTPVQATGGWLR